MRKTLAFALMALLLGSCSYQQYGGTVAGSYLGGMLGSSIGGIAGGWRGHEIGTAVGMVAGGVIGAAATADRSERQSTKDYGYDEMSYGRRPAAETYAPANTAWDYLEVTNLHFKDANGNQRLDRREHAVIVMDIYNRGDRTLYNIAPNVTCSNKKVIVSPTAIFSELSSGEGFRYTVEVIAPAKWKEDQVVFSVAFGEKKKKVTAKTFRLRTGH